MIIPLISGSFTIGNYKNTPCSGLSREIFPRLYYIRPKYPPFPRKWEYACGPLMHSSGGGGGSNLSVKPPCKTILRSGTWLPRSSYGVYVTRTGYIYVAITGSPGYIPISAMSDTVTLTYTISTATYIDHVKSTHFAKILSCLARTVRFYVKVWPWGITLVKIYTYTREEKKTSHNAGHKICIYTCFWKCTTSMKILRCKFYAIILMLFWKVTL